MTLPKEPAILLSYVNTKLRDFYSDFEEFCKAEGASPEEITASLATLDYHYNRERNQFV